MWQDHPGGYVLAILMAPCSATTVTRTPCLRVSLSVTGREPAVELTRSFTLIRLPACVVAVAHFSGPRAVDLWELGERAQQSRQYSLIHNS
jgi:hypothetical protein